MRRTSALIIVFVVIVSLAIGVLVGGMAGGTHADRSLAWTPSPAASAPASATPVEPATVLPR